MSHGRWKKPPFMYAPACLRRQGGLLPAVGEEDLSGPGRLRPGWRWMRGAGIGGGAPGAAPSAAIALFALLSAALCACVQLAADDLLAGAVCPSVFVALFAVGMMLCLMVIWGHRQVSRGDRFRVPLVPFVPALSILCNIALMTHLSLLTWTRFIVWMVIGLLVYYLYGIRHSREGDAAGTYAMLLTSPEAGKGAWGSMQHRQTNAPITDKTPIVPEEEVTQ